MKINIQKAINEEIKEQQINLVSRQIGYLLGYIKSGNYKEEWVAAQADLLYSLIYSMDWETEEQHETIRQMKSQVVQLAKDYGNYDVVEF